MGHVVNPISFRLGHSRYWNSIWSLSNLNNYSQLSNLDFLIIKKILAWFKNVLAHKSLMYIFILNNVRIVRSNKKVFIILQLYDLLTSKLQISILKKVRLQLLKHKLLRVRKWKRYHWIPLYNIEFMKTKRKLIFFLHNVSTGKYLSKKWLTLKFLESKFNFKCAYPNTLNRFVRDFYIRKPNKFNSRNFAKLVVSYSANVFSTKLYKQLSHPQRILNNHSSVFFSLTKLLFFRFFLSKLRSHFFTGFDMIKYALCYYLSPLINLQPSNVILVGLNDLTLDAKFISTFIAYYLENRYYLNQILKVLWGYLDRAIKNRLLYGYQIKLSGRFKKNEKAVYMLRKVGNIGRYDIKRFVDYSFSTARMRLGVTGIKVWAALPSSKDMLIKAKFNNHFTKVYLTWDDINQVQSQIPVNLLRSYVSGNSLSWHSIIHFFSSSVFLPNRISGRFNRSHLSRYSYIY